MIHKFENLILDKQLVTLLGKICLLVLYCAVLGTSMLENMLQLAKQVVLFNNVD